MRYESEAAWTKYDAEAEREHGPSGDVEVYYNRIDAAASEISLTERERENFEEEKDIKLMADVLDPVIFELMVTWLKESNLLHKE